MMVLAGIAIGIPAALGLGRLLSGLLFGVSPRDPTILASVPVVLGLVALGACYAPALKAAAVDPMESLRAE